MSLYLWHLEVKRITLILPLRTMTKVSPRQKLIDLRLAHILEHVGTHKPPTNRCIVDLVNLTSYCEILSHRSYYTSRDGSVSLRHTSVVARAYADLLTGRVCLPCLSKG
jgi:hypothetical protein